MLSQLISGRRRELGMSVAELARATNLSAAYIHSLENPGPGKHERQPTAGVLVDLARVLTLPISQLFGAIGIDVSDLPMPADPQVARLMELVQIDKSLARLVGVWPALTPTDRATITQAAEDLGRLREYLAVVQGARNVD
jgi:transcriptional regulator with XRE-family HTH domain